MSLAWFVQGEEEVDHLVLLALITVIFVVCSLPLTVSSFLTFPCVCVSHRMKSFVDPSRQFDACYECYVQTGQPIVTFIQWLLKSRGVKQGLF